VRGVDSGDCVRQELREDDSMIALATFIAAETWGINQDDGHDPDVGDALATIVMMVVLALFDLQMARILAGAI